ncbi:DoxX family protein [Corynebacterium jeikeium]|uniref:DoxX family protein n=1 Tax=Corynebacterium jeikeium TaxID=38289 RepID=UPI0001B719BC|nr:DoxX family protein [Corynebacterium jeikeium]EEW15737.1 DoxX family protein [Corynebacterium jeikeium ATCC 43734]OOD32866.1 DoxX family membrane protein [Corynebacterium jeikeium]WCZ54532.1 Putative oxidoreductase MhqP [Corynebacterium jeikeium]SUY82366.1 putative integral membrane protein [Corynebacterium jeikeium]
MNIFKDVCITISRILVGIVLIAHGWQKYNSWTIDGTAKSFDSMGVPWPNASAQIATYFELAAGVLLILGLLVRIVGPLLFIQMAFAFGFAHWGKGVFVADGGWELVGVLGAAGLALAASGSGRFSLDYLFMTPVRARKERKEKAAQEANGSYTPAAAPAGAAGAPNAAPNAAPNTGQSPYGSYGSANQGSNFQGSNYQGSNFQGSPAQAPNNQSSNFWGNNQGNKSQNSKPWNNRGNDGYAGYTIGGTDNAGSAGAAGVAGGAGAAGMTNGSDADAPTTQWNSDQSGGPSSNNSFGGFSSSGSDSGSDSGSSGGDGGGDGGGGD